MKRFLPLVLLFIAFGAFAQNQKASEKGSVKGFVYDKANGEGVPFATVKVEGTEFGAATDDQGFFFIPNLAVGSYKLNINYVGYEQQNVDIEIKKNQTNNLSSRMFPLYNVGYQPNLCESS